MRRLLPLTLLLLAAVPAAGCGSDDFDPDVVAQAADKTASAGGSKVAFTVDAAGQSMKGTGFMDAKGRKARMRFELPQNAGAMNMVFLDKVIYMNLPEELRKEIPGDKAWIKIDLAKALRAQGIDLGALNGASSNDPSQQLDQLRGAGDVKKVGSEKVRGTSTTHYKATVDLRKAAKKSPAARRSVERVIKLSGQSTFPVEVWIDKAGRLRRESFEQRVQGQTISTTMDFFDFGSREAIKAPPSSETKDITDLAAKAKPQP
jgi:hypothetical protein